jgi:HK97 family phage portal protein
VGLTRPPSSGRYAERALIPRDPLTPNGNDPASVPPATVGPDVARPGDPDGIDIVTLGDPVPARNWPPPPSHWSGYPAEWATSWDMGAGRLEELSDVAWGCVNLNANLLATMPPYLTGASPSLNAGWLNNPDPDLYTDWTEFAKQLFWDFQMGEAFVLSTARYDNGDGYPARFHVVAPWLVNVEMDAGRRRYTIGGVDKTGDMLHIRYQGRTDDARGHGPLDVARPRLLAANVLSRYATNLASSGGVPSSVLKAPGDLTAAQADALRAQWLDMRYQNLGLPAVLSGGVEWEPTQIDPVRMALVELLAANEGRLCVMLGVPPFLMGLPSGGDSMTYSNVNSLFDYHWRSGLRPLASIVMGALSEWATPHGTRVELNRDAYVQPGPLERAQTWQILTSIGVLTAAQVAQIERYVYHGEASAFTATAPGATL